MFSLSLSFFLFLSHSPRLFFIIIIIIILFYFPFLLFSFYSSFLLYSLSFLFHVVCNSSVFISLSFSLFLSQYQPFILPLSLLSHFFFSSFSFIPLLLLILFPLSCYLPCFLFLRFITYLVFFLLFLSLSLILSFSLHKHSIPLTFSLSLSLSFSPHFSFPPLPHFLSRYPVPFISPLFFSLSSSLLQHSKNYIIQFIIFLDV